MAAVLSVGRGAVLSHRSAAALWALRPSASGAVEVTTTRHSHSRAGIEVHRGSLPPDERTALKGIPVTTVPRTLLDFAGMAHPRDLERAINQAEVLRLTDPLSVGDLIARHPRRAGVAALRTLLVEGRIGATVTRSELEDRFLGFLDRAGLPRPRVNVSLRLRGRWIEADCLWRAQRLIVDLDGHATTPPAPRLSETVLATGHFTRAAGVSCG